MKIENKKKILWNLKKLRKESKISQYKMAEILGYGKCSSYYSKKENGLFEFRMYEMIAIRNILSKALGRELTLDDIFCE